MLTIAFLKWLLFNVEPNAILCDFGISAGVAAALAAAVGSVASAAITSFGKKEPKSIAPPKENDIAQGEADARRRLLTAKGYKSTILSDLTSQFGGGLKTTLGG